MPNLDNKYSSYKQGLSKKLYDKNDNVRTIKLPPLYEQMQNNRRSQLESDISGGGNSTSNN